MFAFSMTKFNLCFVLKKIIPVYTFLYQSNKTSSILNILKVLSSLALSHPNGGEKKNSWSIVLNIKCASVLHNPESKLMFPFDKLYCYFIDNVCCCNRRRMLWKTAVGLQPSTITRTTIWAMGCLNLSCLLWHNKSNVLLWRRHKIPKSSSGRGVWVSI